ncbi:MAG: BMP family ABC transporter substrate-binding protein [Trueperaceae bacterium]
MKNVFAFLAALCLLTLCLLTPAFAQDLDPNRELTVGFIYVGPVGDAGWTYAHDLGRQKLEEALPNVETTIVESVAEADAESAVDQLVADGAEVIFATSFGYGDGILAAAERYPDVIFGHATGYQRAPNVMTYIAEMYQGYYVNGLIAGALSESGLIGYPAAFPIPEVKRHINAFALGALAVNPDAKVEVTWLNAWFAPDAAKEATEALISKGADVFAFTEDTPAVIQTAAAKGFPSFSHYASMYDFSPETVASGQLCHWETIYIDFISKVLSGEYTATNLEDVDYVYLMKEGALEVGADDGMPINPVYEEALKAKMVNDPELGEISVYDLVMTRIEQMTGGEFEPFTGPITDRKGNEVYAEGVAATIPELMSLEWAAPNVVGDWDNEP